MHQSAVTLFTDIPLWHYIHSDDVVLRTEVLFCVCREHLFLFFPAGQILARAPTHSNILSKNFIDVYVCVVHVLPAYFFNQPSLQRCLIWAMMSTASFFKKFKNQRWDPFQSDVFTISFTYTVTVEADSCCKRKFRPSYYNIEGGNQYFYLSFSTTWRA